MWLLVIIIFHKIDEFLHQHNKKIAKGVILFGFPTFFILVFTQISFVKNDVPSVSGQFYQDEKYFYNTYTTKAEIKKYELVSEGNKKIFFIVIDKTIGTGNLVELCVNDVDSSFWDVSNGTLKRKIPTSVNWTFKFDTGEEYSITENDKFCRVLENDLSYELILTSNITRNDRDESKGVVTFFHNLNYDAHFINDNLIRTIIIVYIGWMAFVLFLNELYKFVFK